MILHPLTLIHALKDVGMSCRAEGGRLLVNPVALLAGELREQVITNRAALVAWLEGAADDEARIDAVAGFWAEHPGAADCFLVRAPWGEIIGCASSAELAQWDEARRPAPTPPASEVVGEGVPVPTHKKPVPRKPRKKGRPS